MLDSSPLAGSSRAPAPTAIAALWSPGVLRWVIPLGLLAIAGALGWWFRGHQLDDPFITYRYAANLAAGRGFAYNEGERVLATTSPLFALILAGLGRLGLDIPVAGYWVSVLALGLAGYHLYRIGVCAGRPEVGLGAALLLVSSPDAMLTFGLESTLYLALLTGTVWAATAGRPGLAGFVLGLATLTRGDAVVLGGVLLGAWLWRTRRLPIRALAGWGLVTGLWALGATWYFGWPLPVTLAAKMLQGQAEFWTQRFLSGLPQVWQEYHTSVAPLFWCFIPIWIAGLIEASIRDRRWLIWPVWAALYVAAYGLLNVPSYYWYYAPLLPALAVLAALGASGLTRWLTTALRWPRARYGMIASVLVGVPLLLAQVQLTRYWDQRLPAPYVVTYRELGQWLADRTPAGSSVGTLEIGLLGYYSGRRMIDFAGLLQPPIAHHVAHDDFLWAVEAYRPDYVVWSPQRDYWLTNSTEFAARYREVYRFPNAYLDPLIVSQRHLEN